MNNSLRRILPFLLASRIIIILNVLVVIFHLCVLAGLVPYNVVWGGNIQSKQDMYLFETVSIAVNLFLILLVGIKLRKPQVKHPAVNVLLWIFVAVFVLNTAGNLAAAERIEMLLATPLTFILAVLCWRVAIEKPLTGTQEDPL